MTDATGRPPEHRIQGLDQLLAAANSGKMPPVERWNPPYCGSIGMRIRADGVWLYQNSPIGRPALVKLFSRILRRDSDGRTYLVTPVEKVDVEVDDAPFLAVEMQVERAGPDQKLIFRTNVDDIVPCGPHHPLRFEQAPEGGLKPYLRVRGGLDALLTRALYYDLIDLAVSKTHGCVERLGLWSGGMFFPVEASG